MILTSLAQPILHSLPRVSRKPKYQLYLQSCLVFAIPQISSRNLATFSASHLGRTAQAASIPDSSSCALNPPRARRPNRLIQASQTAHALVPSRASQARLPLETCGTTLARSTPCQPLAWPYISQPDPAFAILILFFPDAAYPREDRYQSPAIGQQSQDRNGKPLPTCRGHQPCFDGWLPRQT
jgi:hypothetical protein